MAYQKILTDKESTYGSPYCIYTVEVEPTNRTSDGVTLNIRVSSHLKYSNSNFGTGNGYYLTGHLTVLKTDIPITIKKTGESWSGTAVHTATASKSFSNIASTTTKLKATFSVTSGVSDKACGLDTTTCSNINIGAAPAPAHGIHIDNGSSISAYRCYIDNGSTWVEYEPYIDNGTSFVKY